MESVGRVARERREAASHSSRARRRRAPGQAQVWIDLPERLIGEGIRGNPHTSRHAPECAILPDNSGTVTAEAYIDAEVDHHLVRAEGERIDHDVIHGYADLVCREWHSGPP